MAGISKPNPGSDDAVAKGCRCPVMDNARGKGGMLIDGLPTFWVSEDCPLHGTKQADAGEGEKP